LEQEAIAYLDNEGNIIDTQTAAEEGKSGEAIPFEAGMTIVVTAGIRHGLLAGDEPWVLRETVHRRVYARKAIKRAIKKRLR